MSIPKISKYRPIFNGLLKGEYDLALSESILQEYIEIVGIKTTGQIAQNLGDLLMSLQNVTKTEIFFRWDLIQADPDDNKFVDCAISAYVTFLVSNDNHFKELKSTAFPSVEVVDADTFLERVKKII